jgi:hypothetical protein
VWTQGEAGMIRIKNLRMTYGSAAAEHVAVCDVSPGHDEIRRCSGDHAGDAGVHDAACGFILVLCAQKRPEHDLAQDAG